SRLLDLAVAVDQCRCVKLDYRDREGRSSSRVIEPYRLIQLDRRWFMVAHCRLREGPRSFRLDRIIDFHLTDEPFTRPLDFDAAAFLYRSLALQQSTWTVVV